MVRVGQGDKPGFELSWQEKFDAACSSDGGQASYPTTIGCCLVGRTHHQQCYTPAEKGWFDLLKRKRQIFHSTNLWQIDFLPVDKWINNIKDQLRVSISKISLECAFEFDDVI